VLGAVLLEARHLDTLVVETGLRPEHFYREQSGLAFAAMRDPRALDRRIDHLTVGESLQQAGQPEQGRRSRTIDELTGWVPAAGDASRVRWIGCEEGQLRDLLWSIDRIQHTSAGRPQVVATCDARKRIDALLGVSVGALDAVERATQVSLSGVSRRNRLTLVRRRRLLTRRAAMPLRRVG
jgi:replicative DNA helicase